MKTLKYGLFTALIALSAISCEDDPDPVVTTTTEEKASLHLHIDHKFNTDNFSLDQNFTLTSGEVVKFSTAQFYLGNYKLMDDAQQMTGFPDSYLLVDPTVSHQNIGEMDAKHYHMVMLNMGVDSTTNTDFQPIDFADSHALAAKVNNMWWSWNAGYIFFKLEGEIDHDADGTFDDVFEYHIGTNANRLDLQKMLHKDVAAGEMLELDLTVDYAKFFNGLDLSIDLQAHMGPPAIVASLKANAALAFTLD